MTIVDHFPIFCYSVLSENIGQLKMTDDEMGRI